MRRQPTSARPRLTRALILKCAKVHFRHKGEWPTMYSGPVIGQPGENWQAIDYCLRAGSRGLLGGSSLARLLGEAGLKPYRLAPLTLEQIVVWLEADYKETGKWPTLESGPVRAAPGKKWSAIHVCLERGHRGLPGGMTLARLVRFHQNLLLRAHWILPVKDGERIITTAAQLTAVLVCRHPLQQPDLLWSLKERQRKFQEKARRQGRRRRQ